jgi:hypothetical protein
VSHVLRLTAAAQDDIRRIVWYRGQQDPRRRHFDTFATGSRLGLHWARAHDSNVDSSPAIDSIRFTEYFDREVLRKRNYLRKDWCIRVLQAPARVERREGDRWRFWAVIAGLDGR